MTPWSSREELVQRIVTLSREKVSRRSIAVSLGVSRNTVRQVLEEHAKQREAEHSALPRASKRAPRASKLDPYKERARELLDKYADITAQRVFEMLKAEGFDGGTTAVKKHVRRVRTKPKRKPSLETPDYGPGKMAESDWSPYKLTYTDGSTQEISAPSKAPRGKKGDVYLDELAHYVNDREVYRGSTALILRSCGQLSGCSTPLGRRGIFWEIATEELRRYPHHTRHDVPWWACRFFCRDMATAMVEAPDMPTEERVTAFGTQSIIEQLDSLPLGTPTVQLVDKVLRHLGCWPESRRRSASHS